MNFMKHFGGKGIGLLKDDFIMDYLGTHDIAKTVSNIGYRARDISKQSGDKEFENQVMKLIGEFQMAHRDILNEVWELHKEQEKFDKLKDKIKTTTMIKADEIKTKEDLQLFNQQMMQNISLIKEMTNLIDDDTKTKVINLVMGLHDIEKIAAQLNGEVERTMPEIKHLTKRLCECFDDIYKSQYVHDGAKRLKYQDEVLKKYAHNIPSVIKVNNKILFLEHGIDDKDLLGNKGAQLVTMHKLGIQVPKSIFLTTKTCKVISETQSVEFYPFLNNLMLSFGENKNNQPNKIAIRSSGVISMPGMMDTVLDVDRNDETAVCTAILNIVNSWNSDRAIKYRKICNISDDIKIAIVIQPMIRGDKGYSGICFTRDINTGKNILTGEYLENQLGDKLASGSVTPKQIKPEFNNLPKHVYLSLNKTAIELERHYKCPQEFEFVAEQEGDDKYKTHTYIVQTRNAKLSVPATVNSLIDLHDIGIINKEEFKKGLPHNWIAKCKTYKAFDHNGFLNGFLFKATPCSSGILTGTVITDVSRITPETINPILFIDKTTPNELPLIEKVSGVITRIGGFSSHPAVVCRELNKPCICGADNIKIVPEFNYITVKKTGLLDVTVMQDDIITMNGATGEVYIGTATFQETILHEKEVNEILNLED